MRILIYSRAFLPKIGGLELNVAHLAEQLVQRGHEVVVITSTPAEGNNGLPYRVLRNVGPLTFLRWVRWCGHRPSPPPAAPSRTAGTLSSAGSGGAE